MTLAAKYVWFGPAALCFSDLFCVTSTTGSLSRPYDRLMFPESMNTGLSLSAWQAVNGLSCGKGCYEVGPRGEVRKSFLKTFRFLGRLVSSANSREN